MNIEQHLNTVSNHPIHEPFKPRRSRLKVMKERDKETISNQRLLKLFSKFKEGVRFLNAKDLSEKIKRIILDNSTEYSKLNLRNKIQFVEKAKHQQKQTSGLRLQQMIQNAIIQNQKSKLAKIKNYFSKTILTTWNPNNIVIIIWNFLQTLIVLYNCFAFTMTDTFNEKFVNDECQFKNIVFSFTFLQVFNIFLKFNILIYKNDFIIKNRKEIASIYLFHSKGFFFEIIAIFGLLIQRTNYFMHEGCGIGDPKSMLFINLLKYLYFIKLEQVKSFFRLIQNECHTKQVLQSFLKILELFIFMAMVSHTVSCVWVSVGNTNFLNNQPNWLTFMNVDSKSWQNQYLMAQYFALMTMTTVGYGDLVPQNPQERLTAIFVMIFCAGIFAYLLNTITKIIKELHQSTQQYTKDLLAIEAYMNRLKIHSELQNKVKSYIKCYYHSGMDKNIKIEQQVINKLSKELQEELCYQEKGKMLKSIPLINDHFKDVFIRKLMHFVTKKFYSPGDVIFDENNNDCLIYVQQGKAQVSAYINHHDHNLYSIVQGQYEGLEKLFVENRLNKLKATCQDFSVIYQLKTQDFYDLVNSEDHLESFNFLNYFQIKQTILENNLLNFEFYCNVCNQSGHNIYKCKKLFFIPNISLILEKFRFNVSMPRQETKRLKKAFQVRTFLDLKFCQEQQTTYQKRFERLKSFIFEEEDQINKINQNSFKMSDLLLPLSCSTKLQNLKEQKKSPLINIPLIKRYKNSKSICFSPNKSQILILNQDRKISIEQQGSPQILQRKESQQNLSTIKPTLFFIEDFDKRHKFHGFFDNSNYNKIIKKANKIYHSIKLNKLGVFGKRKLFQAIPRVINIEELAKSRQVNVM